MLQAWYGNYRKALSEANDVSTMIAQSIAELRELDQDTERGSSEDEGRSSWMFGNDRQDP